MVPAMVMLANVHVLTTSPTTDPDAHALHPPPSILSTSNCFQSAFPPILPSVMSSVSG